MVSVFLAGYGAFAGSVIRVLSVIVVEGYGGSGGKQWFQALTGRPWMRSVDQWIAAVWLGISILPAPAWIVYGMRCLHRGTMRAEAFGLGVILPLPVFVARWCATRIPHVRTPHLAEGEQRNALAMYRTLSAPYGARYWYWDAVLLFQRQVYGLLALFLRWNLVARAYTMTIFSIGIFLVHVHTRPFCSVRANLVEYLAFGALLAVCTSTTVAAYRFELGVESSRYVDALHMAGTICLGGVACAALVVLLCPILRRCLSREGKSKPAGNVRSLLLPLLGDRA